MRRAPSCLLFAVLLIPFSLALPEAASAQPGVRHGAGQHHSSAMRSRLTQRHRIGNHHRFHGRLADHRGHGRNARHFSRHKHPIFPHHSWGWPYVEGTDATQIVIEQGAPTAYQLPVVPSLADLPVSAGIRSAPVGSPAIFVINSSGRSSGQSSGGAKGPDADETVSDSSGPRIIHLNVPRGP